MYNMHLVPELYQAVFLRYRMQVMGKRNFMDICYINCFSHSLYLSRARELFHVSNVSCLSFTLYISEIVYI